MISFQNVPLWKRTLARQRKSDDSQESRERLRSALLSFRERAAMLAAEIARDLPDFTVHDITHLDALWQLADLVAGPTYDLTPTEAFVLGGAFLIHDLGMGLSAYPDGIGAMYSSTAWRDTISIILRKTTGRTPTSEQIESANESVKKAATGQVLRALHAQQAERLGLVSWKDPDNGTDRFLIEDIFLRDTYGRLIGRIAHSHWWPVEKLRTEFGTEIGAPVICPATWTIDPLKLACLLRVADAAHLDARRAPTFLKAVRQPSENSRIHWSFQERLQQPRRDADRLVYTSSRPFQHSEATSWWLCFDSLQILDRELSETDAILADCGRPRFAVRGVQGAEDASRLSKWIQTDDWMPIDTRIRVTDVAELARKLGGAQLYGDDHLVPLRELIQNAADAIRARCHIEERSSDFGEVIVRIGSDAEGNWIEVADNGIGMSEKVLTGPFLDFGTSFWNSEAMMQELPGLASSGFESTGKYGIGFFSLFMWGEHVRVLSRSYRDAPDGTRVLEFKKGLHVRPTLRRAENREQLLGGGTTVRVWVGLPPEAEGGILFRSHQKRGQLAEICEWLCPAVDTNIYVQRDSLPKQLVVEASDWKTIDGEKLLNRLTENEVQAYWIEEQKALIKLVAPNLELVHNSEGDIVGRVAITPEDIWITTELGAVTAGGLRACGLYRIAGILTGVTETASRNYALPILEPSILAKWASDQAKKLLRMQFPEDEPVEPILSSAAGVITRCGGEIGTLPIVETRRRWFSIADLLKRKSLPDEIILVDTTQLDEIKHDYDDIELGRNVFVCDSGTRSFLNVAGIASPAWPRLDSSFSSAFEFPSNQYLVVDILARKWGATIQEVLKISQISHHSKYFYHEIGIVNGKELTRSVHIIRNPNSKRYSLQKPADEF